MECKCGCENQVKEGNSYINGHFNKNKNYEQLYGEEKANSLRKNRSMKTRERMKEQNYKDIAIKNISEWNIRNNNSIGKNNPNFGKSCKRNFKRFNYKGIWFKSSWEKIFAKFLDKQKLTWEYEPERFEFRDINMTYLPDFWVNEMNSFIEIKGYWSTDDYYKIDSFRQEYSDRNLIVFDDIQLIKNMEKNNAIC